MENEHYIQIAQAIIQPVCLLGDDGEIVYANEAACGLFQRDLADFRLLRLHDVVKAGEGSSIEQCLASWAGSSNPQTTMLELCLVGGGSRQCKFCGSMLRSRTGKKSALILLQCGDEAGGQCYLAMLNEKIASLVEENSSLRKAELTQENSRKSLERAQRIAHVGSWEWDLGDNTVAMSEESRNIFWGKDNQTYPITVESLVDRIHPAYQQSFKKSMDRVFVAPGESYDLEYRVVRPDGDGRVVVAQGEVVRDEEGRPVRLIGIVQDITERKSMEEAMARIQDTLERAQAIAHVGSWDWDIAGGALYWTDEIYRIFGLTPQQFGATYESFLEYIHGDDRASVIDAVNRTVADKNVPYNIVHRVVRPDGTERIVNERGNVYRDELGQPIRMIGTVQDITEKKLADDEIRKLNEELELRVEERTAELQLLNKNLQQSLEALKRTQDQLVQSEKMAALGGLVAGIAHEINTPVGVGVTAVSHLELKLEDYAKRYDAGTLTRDDFERLILSAKETSKIVHHNLRRAANLISSFKQVAVDQTSNETREFNLVLYLQEVVQSLSPKLKSGGHQVSIDGPEGIVMSTSPGALSQVFTNLIVNSIVHGFDRRKNGNISIAASLESGEKVRIDYSDDGNGIAQRHVARIFEPFFTTARSKGGTGLGMHIVFNLVTQTLGGTIQCSSAEGAGVKFRIELPLRCGTEAVRQGLKSA